ncbi:MAG: SLBB domain-containing protein, partial [Proteobacteria bacterium]|nr:SLBB domain-containing protein [Pseudomonadota bacterium]
MKEVQESRPSRKGGRKRALPGLTRLLVLLVALGSLCSLQASAQSSASLLDQLLQSNQPNLSGTSTTTTPYSAPATQTIQPSTTPTAQQAASQPAQVELPPSRLEEIMSKRAGVRLRQFGYNQFGVGSPVQVPQSGALVDNYILGPGDEIVVSLRGQDNSEFRAVVDRDGRVTLPRLKPILAAGRTLGDFRRDVQNAVQSAYIQTQAYVTIGALRQVSVSVSGEVNNPGVRLVNGLSSVVDAILLSGGIKKSGSLRNVRLIRDGHATIIDLYNYLTDRGHARISLLSDGDRIVVPPLGPTVAVTGWVRRPAIYEMMSATRATTARSIMQLAGGPEVRGRYRLSLLRISPDGAIRLEPATEASMVRDSEILFVQPEANQVESQATLAGGVPLAGQYSLGKSTTLAEMLKSPGALGENPYSLFGVISRRDPVTLLRTLQAFSPVAVLSGRQNLQLQSGDIVRVISMKEARLLSAVVRAFKDRRASAAELARAPTSSENLKDQLAPAQATPGVPLSTNVPSQLVTGTAATDSNAIQNTPWFLRQNGGIKDERQDVAELSNMVLSDGGILASAGPSQGNGGFSTPAQNFEVQDLQPDQVASNRSAMTYGDFSNQVDADPLVLMHFLMDHEASIGGAVRGAGDYLVGPDVTLQDLVAAAGGTSGWVDQSGVEIISTNVDAVAGVSHTNRQLLPFGQSQLASYSIKPHDEIRFNPVYATVDGGSVTLQGQVHSPGTYKIEKGEHLSELLLRAGGLTDLAYPYGTVFLRKSVAAVEQDGYRRAADEMQNMLLTSGSALGSQAVSASGVASLIQDLRNAKPLGRISIIA